MKTYGRLGQFKPDMENEAATGRTYKDCGVVALSLLGFIVL
jgi:hypothetical protein